MESINYTLQKISSDLFIRYDSRERTYIQQRVQIINNSLKQYFNNEVKEIIIFGSYSRDTILPRKFDERSDIDILVVFNQGDKELNPETYRSKLKRFAELKYPNTNIVKDHPSIVLEMSNIKFDLVPCRIYNGFWSNYYQIPSRQEVWIDTYPNDFNKELSSVNNQYGSIVKPIIRLMKRWNAYNDYPFETFQLEKIIANMNFSNDNYKSGFFYGIDNLPSRSLSLKQLKKVEALRKNKSQIVEHLKRNNQKKATEILCKILGITI